MLEPHQLPHTQDFFHWHLYRARYTAPTWKSALQCDPIRPSPKTYGWTVRAQHHLQIYWISLPPVPDAVLSWFRVLAPSPSVQLENVAVCLYVPSVLTCANVKTAKILRMKTTKRTAILMRTRLILTPATLYNDVYVENNISVAYSNFM